MKGIAQRIGGGLIVLLAGWGLCGASMSAAAPVSVAPKVFIADVSPWVMPREWAPPAARPADADSEGTRHLLYEFQACPAKTEEFVRVVMLMENEAGVQDSGNLSFGFDPSYEELILHRVSIHRDGRELNRLEVGKVKVIQPETGLYGHMFTGRQTALVFVEDLRVGDVLEYSYTTRGANPVLQGHFARRLTVQSGVSVERQRLRVVWDGSKPLHRRQHLLEAEPRVTPLANGAEYVWDFDFLPSIPWEDYLPIGFEAYPYVEVSDFEGWSRVVEWALPLYHQPETNLPPDLAALIAQWQREGETDEKRARLALQFVQDDLRYTGLELGPDSYRPAPPFETFEKRYGDCKGKVSLFCLMLARMNIEARPALVSTYARDALARRLASPFAFNHVIAKVTVNGRVAWVDPTRSHQGGNLWQRYLPPLGKALVIEPGNRSLEDIPPPDPEHGRQHMTSTFKLADYSSPAQFEVVTLYRGYSADDMRETLARSDTQELGKDYLNYYDRYYPGVTGATPLRIKDDREKNTLQITEQYEVPGLWKFNPAARRDEAAFYADSLVSMLSDPSTRQRKLPLRLPYPRQRSQEVIVHLPDRNWNISAAERQVEHEGFSFKYRRKLSGATLRWNYECETRLPELSPEQVAGYLDKLDELENQLGDTLIRANQSQAGILGRINWLMVVIAVFAFGGAVAGAGWYWWLFARAGAGPAPDLPPVLSSSPNLNGLGGWLVLVGINLCLGPLLRIGQLVYHWEGFFGLAAWQAVALPGAESYHVLYAPLLIGEVVGNIALLAVNLLAIWLFFTKSRAFPRVFIFLLVGSAVLIVADSALCSVVPYLAENNSTGLRDSVRSVFHAFIWCSYAVLSKRVKATFVR